MKQHLKVSKYPIVKNVPQPPKKFFVIGDIHGCLDELVELTNQVSGMVDKVILTGDLLDRGPYGPETVQFARAAKTYGNLEVVLGNHDEKHIRYRNHINKKKVSPDYKIPMRCPEDNEEAHRAMSDEDIEWLASLPAAIRYHGKNHKYLITHAGLVPGRGLKQQTSGLIRNRYIKKEDGVYKNVQTTGLEVPKGAMLWSDVWMGPEIVIHGHIVYDKVNPLIKHYAIGLDTGCCFGGRLTGVIIDTETDQRSFYSVEAKKTYRESQIL